MDSEIGDAFPATGKRAALEVATSTAASAAVPAAKDALGAAPVAKPAAAGAVRPAPAAKPAAAQPAAGAKATTPVRAGISCPFGVTFAFAFVRCRSPDYAARGGETRRNND